MVEVQLQSAGTQLVDVAARFDVDCLGGPSAVEHLRYVASLVSSLSGLESRLARRCEETNAYVMTSHTSTASLVAEVGGLSHGEAVELLQTARQLASSPDTEAALSSGSISASAAKEVARGVAVDPSTEHFLLDTAKADSVSSVKKEATRVVASSGSRESQAGRAERVRKNRFISSWDAGDGSRSGRFNMPNEMWARLWSVLEPEAKRQFQTARKNGRRESQGAYLVDALVEVATTSTHGGSSRGSLNVTIDHEALKRGHVGPGEVCEVPGVGPVPVAVARDLFDDCLLTILVKDGQDIRTVASRSRHVPADVRRALDSTERVCSVRGCESKKGLQRDHRQEVQDGGMTSYDNLADLCTEHHHLKTEGFIELIGPPGDYVAVFTGKEGPRYKGQSKKAKGPPPSLF